MTSCSAVLLSQWPGDEIVPLKVSDPAPVVGPVKTPEAAAKPLPVAPENRPVPPMTV